MRDVRGEIEEIVNRETAAWDAQDAGLLLTVFHPDMVWPWPPDPASHDPADWVMPFGRFDAARWGRNWQELFDTHELVHNRRSIVRIEVSPEGDGAVPPQVRTRHDDYPTDRVGIRKPRSVSPRAISST